MSTQPHSEWPAHAVLRELGWDRVTVEQALTLPLGDPEQRRTVKALLARGEWYDFSHFDDPAIAHTPANEAVLAVYAARVGLPVAVVADLVDVPSPYADDEFGRSQQALGWWAAADLVTERGPAAEWEYVCSFLDDSRRPSRDAPTIFGGHVLRRVHDSRLELPPTEEYTKDFWAHAAARLDTAESSDWWTAGKEPVEEDVLRARFPEHVRLTGQLAGQMTRGFGPAVAEGMRRGWVQREEVLDAALVALDATVRASDRRVWAGILSRELAESAQELLANRDRIIPVLSVGDAPVVEALGLPLLKVVPDQDLPELLVALSGTPTLKARKAVLAQLRKRPAPPAAVAMECLESLRVWGQVGTQLAAALNALSKAWDLPDADAVADADAGRPAAAEFAWPATPQLWTVPRVDFGEASLDALTAAALPLLDREEGFVDLAVERFLALANALALSEPERIHDLVHSLVRWHEWRRPGLDDVARWVKHGRARHDRGSDPLDERRTGNVAGRLGLSPVILSAPSWEDLRVDLADLTAGLEILQEAGLGVLESDLTLALTRLEPDSDLPQLRARLAALDLPLMTWQGDPNSGTNAADVVLAYLEDVAQEPALLPAPRRGQWLWRGAKGPASLRALRTLPRGLGKDWRGATLSIFPTWGDAVGPSLRVSLDREAPEDIPAALWLQVARRSRPLTPGLAMNLLAGLRRKVPSEREVQFEAARLAWERGLLVPGVPSVDFLTGKERRASCALWSTPGWRLRRTDCCRSSGRSWTSSAGGERRVENWPAASLPWRAPCAVWRPPCGPRWSLAPRRRPCWTFPVCVCWPRGQTNPRRCWAHKRR